MWIQFLMPRVWNEPFLSRTMRIHFSEYASHESTSPICTKSRDSPFCRALYAVSSKASCSLIRPVIGRSCSCPSETKFYSEIESSRINVPFCLQFFFSQLSSNFLPRYTSWNSIRSVSFRLDPTKLLQIAKFTKFQRIEIVKVADFAVVTYVFIPTTCEIESRNLQRICRKC